MTATTRYTYLDYKVNNNEYVEFKAQTIGQPLWVGQSIADFGAFVNNIKTSNFIFCKLRDLFPLIQVLFDVDFENSFIYSGRVLEVKLLNSKIKFRNIDEIREADPDSDDFTFEERIKQVEYLSNKYKTNIPLTKSRELEKHLAKYNIGWNKCKLTVDKYKFVNACISVPSVVYDYKHLDKTITNVANYDLTSSFVSRCFYSDLFPINDGEILGSISVDKLEELINTPKRICCIKARFNNIISNHVFGYFMKEGDKDKAAERNRIEYIENEMLAIGSNTSIIAADELVINFVSTEWEIIKQVYTWESIEILDCLVYTTGHFPHRLQTALIDLYTNKKAFKGIEGKENEYLTNKVLFNAAWGNMIKRFHREGNLEDSIKKYNQSKRYLFYAWGLTIASLSKVEYWKTIIALGDDFIYGDTDSAKCKNNKRVRKYFKEYNENMKNLIQSECHLFGIKSDVISDIGQWTDEGVSKRFKFIGSKKYIAEKNIIKPTFAGKNIKRLSEYLSQYDEFEAFNNDMNDASYVQNILSSTKEGYPVYIENYVTENQRLSLKLKI